MSSRAAFVVWLALGALAIRPAAGAPDDKAAPPASQPAPGAGPSDLTKAQAFFDQAQIAYLGGKYDDAARGFMDAYTARPFPQFLYNVGAAWHMKGKTTSSPEAYQKAVDAYKGYLQADPKATDRPKVEKAIGVLEAEIARLKATPVPTDAGSGSGSAAPPAGPSQEVQNLGDVKVRGLVVIDSDPSGATVYLDDQRKGAFATTPWSGTLEGDHKVIIEKRGYMVVEQHISADPSKLFVLVAAMSQSSYLGWVKVTSNVPGADVYIDDKSVGAVGKTPLEKNIAPGKHTFWITAEGYNEYKEDVEIVASGTHEVKGTLKGTPVGKLTVKGIGIEDATIYVDGQILCERGPCIKSVSMGDHTLTVTRPGFKPYTRRITIQQKTETEVKIGLSPKPGRSDAIITYILAAGFGGAGVYLGLQSNKYHDDIQKEIKAGNPPPDSNDPRFFKGKAFSIGADAAFALAGITALTAVYYTFREKGPPSTGLIDVRALAITPEIGPGYAGLGMEMHW
ncbi:MAG TPA: PEGA domain-containing protein [Kofleriaceae bacterium]|jgi:hypothetical protein